MFDWQRGKAMQKVPLYDGSGVQVQGQAMMDFVCSLNVIFAVKQQADDGCTIKRNVNSSGIKMIELDRATEGLVHAVVKYSAYLPCQSLVDLLCCR
jgi:hypothetical protein